jgi:hypothetical protein
MELRLAYRERYLRYNPGLDLMYCTSCGQALSIDSGFCTRCGNPVAQAQAVPIETVRSSSRIACTQPRGLGGWLLFFWIGMVFLKPLFEFRDATTSVGAIHWVIPIGIIAVCITTGVFIYQEDPRALTMLKVFLIVEGIFALLLLVEAALAYHDGERLFYRDSPFVAGTKLGLPTTVWWLYFRQSVRVRNTFGRNL